MLELFDFDFCKYFRIGRKKWVLSVLLLMLTACGLAEPASWREPGVLEFSSSPIWSPTKESLRLYPVLRGLSFDCSVSSDIQATLQLSSSDSPFKWEQAETFVVTEYNLWGISGRRVYLRDGMPAREPGESMFMHWETYQLKLKDTPSVFLTVIFSFSRWDRPGNATPLIKSFFDCLNPG